MSANKVVKTQAAQKEHDVAKGDEQLYLSFGDGLIVPSVRSWEGTFKGDLPPLFRQHSA